MNEDMHDGGKANILKEHEKFWAFVFLVVAILGLALLASTFDKGTVATDLVMQAKLRIIDATIAGLLTITGMAAQALFRVSSVDRQNAATFARTMDKVPEPEKKPQAVEVVNTPENPANVTEANAPAEDLPEYAR